MTMRKLVREGKLKARILKDKNGVIYKYIFLKGRKYYQTIEKN